MMLPVPVPQLDSESPLCYGLYLFCFVLGTGVTATLTDDDLALADHAYPAALAPGLDGRTVDSYSRARTLIGNTLRARQAEQKGVEALGAPARSAMFSAPSAPVPLQPVPRVQPPAPAYAVPRAPELAF